MSSRRQARPGAFSIAMIGGSLVASVSISLATDVALVWTGREFPVAALASLVFLFNATCVLMSAVGGIIEWRRPGHAIGRLLMLGGPLYAFLGAGWTVSESVEPFVDRDLYLGVQWFGWVLSWPGVALVAGWIPLLFPTGTLPGPRWRGPVVLLVVLSGIGLTSMALRPGRMVDEIPMANPLGINGWPPFLQLFVDLVPFELMVLLGLAIGSLVIRYRRGEEVERLQTRWFLAAVSLALVGFAGVVVEQLIRNDDGPLLSAFVVYAGILLMPIAIGIAILRYRLYEIDRIISRTVAWATLTTALVAVFVGGVIALQAALAGFTRDDSIPVAASTLVAAALFQPLRRRIQAAVDRRFDRARYDAGRVVDDFATRLRDELDLETMRGEVARVASTTVRPAAVQVWIRGARRT